jgi:DNA-binding SARP family transcriptional activator
VVRLILPECGTHRAGNNNLRQRVFRLHKAVGQSVVVGRETVRLVDGIAHDLEGVEQSLADEPDACVGDVLGVFDYSDCEELASWMYAVRTRWRATRREALDKVVRRLESSGQVDQALRYAERLTEEPTFEPA